MLQDALPDHRPAVTQQAYAVFADTADELEGCGVHTEAVATEDEVFDVSGRGGRLPISHDVAVPQNLPQGCPRVSLRSKSGDDNQHDRSTEQGKIGHEPR